MSFHRTPVDLPRGARATGTHHFGSQPAHLPSARGRSPVAVPADTTASATRVAPSGGRFGHPSMTHDGSAALPPSSGLPGILGFFATAASDDPALHTPHRHGTPAPHLSGSGRGGRGGRRPTGMPLLFFPRIRLVKGVLGEEGRSVPGPLLCTEAGSTTKNSLAVETTPVHPAVVAD